MRHSEDTPVGRRSGDRRSSGKRIHADPLPRQPYLRILNHFEATFLAVIPWKRFPSDVIKLPLNQGLRLGILRLTQLASIGRNQGGQRLEISMAIRRRKGSTIVRRSSLVSMYRSSVAPSLVEVDSSYKESPLRSSSLSPFFSLAILK